MLKEFPWVTFKGYIKNNVLHLYNKCYEILNPVYPRSVVYEGFYLVHIVDDWVVVKREIHTNLYDADSVDEAQLVDRLK